MNNKDIEQLNNYFENENKKYTYLSISIKELHKLTIKIINNEIKTETELKKYIIELHNKYNSDNILNIAIQLYNKPYTEKLKKLLIKHNIEYNLRIIK